MKIGFLLGLLLAALLAVFAVPLDILSVEMRERHAQWFGQPAYREPPPNAPVLQPTIDLDEICPPEFAAWREAQQIDNVDVAAVPDCAPDNPWEVAAAVRGTNRVSDATLMQTLFAPDTIDKGEDTDGDGDPDVIDIRLEVMELNGHSPDSDALVPQFEIAPGINPGFWVFAPKTRGMTTINFESLVANRMIRLPAPVIRIEQGDVVRIHLENTHYLPHTIHFHGLDHAFKNAAGEGNDGVPLFSEHPTMPGAAKTYSIQARHAGTTFYHCHVQPDTHILMGLQGMLVVEENRPNNWLQTLNIGAGRVRKSSVAVSEEYDREYDLHYLEIDSRLNNRIQAHSDPRLISRSIHRGYNITERQANYYVLNGRSFPYTLRESMIVVREGQRNRLRILNGGNEGLALHFHGHKPTLTHRDGVALAEGNGIQRDVFWLASAQRADLSLNTTNDGLNAYGRGAWLMHDHREQAVTTNGINPGGDISLLVYESYLGRAGLPNTVGDVQDLAPYFNPAYYRGEVPVFAAMHDSGLVDPSRAGASHTRTYAFYAALLFICIFAIALVRR